MKKIILASGSPRRSELLRLAEVPFEIILKKTSEDYPSGIDENEIAIHIAKNKALAVWKYLTNEHPSNLQYPVLAADTIVVNDKKIIGKPKDREDAIQMLTDLSGKWHKVITGVCILYKDREIIFSDTTSVEFDDLSKEQIEYYIDKYKPFDKAGAYGIQEWLGVTGIKSVEGNFYNVMGLPVSRVVRELSMLES